MVLISLPKLNKTLILLAWLLWNGTGYQILSTRYKIPELIVTSLKITKIVASFLDWYNSWHNSLFCCNYSGWPRRRLNFFSFFGHLLLKQHYFLIWQGKTILFSPFSCPLFLLSFFSCFSWLFWRFLSDQTIGPWLIRLKLLVGLAICPC